MRRPTVWLVDAPTARGSRGVNDEVDGRAAVAESAVDDAGAEGLVADEEDAPALFTMLE